MDAICALCEEFCDLVWTKDGPWQVTSCCQYEEFQVIDEY